VRAKTIRGVLKAPRTHALLFLDGRTEVTFAPESDFKVTFASEHKCEIERGREIYEVDLRRDLEHLEVSDREACLIASKARKILL
jgi:hypothetical protein